MTAGPGGPQPRGVPHDQDGTAWGDDDPFDTLAQVQAATADWVRWHNQERLHSSLGYCAPDDIEAAYYDVAEPADRWGSPHKTVGNKPAPVQIGRDGGGDCRVLGGAIRLVFAVNSQLAFS
jgi:hypothetical protein